MIRLLPLLLLAASASAVAQESPAVDPSVVSVVSGGYWETPGNRGSYRVIVFRGGFEHVSTWVVAEWLREPQSSAEQETVKTSRQLVGPGFFSLDTPRLSISGDRVQVRLEGVYTHEPGRHVTCVFDLLPTGEYIEVRACK